MQSHLCDYWLQTYTNWHSLRIADHRIVIVLIPINSYWFAVTFVLDHLQPQANTIVSKCSKQSHWSCELKSIRTASPNIVSIRVSSCWFVSHRVSIPMSSLRICTGSCCLSGANQYDTIGCPMMTYKLTRIDTV